MLRDDLFAVVKATKKRQEKEKGEGGIKSVQKQKIIM